MGERYNRSLVKSACAACVSVARGPGFPPAPQPREPGQCFVCIRAPERAFPTLLARWRMQTEAENRDQTVAEAWSLFPSTRLSYNHVIVDA